MTRPTIVQATCQWRFGALIFVLWFDCLVHTPDDPLNPAFALKHNPHAHRYRTLDKNERLKDRPTQVGLIPRLYTSLIILDAIYKFWCYRRPGEGFA